GRDGRRCNSSVQRIDSKEAPGIEVSSGTSFFDLAGSFTFSPPPARSRPSTPWALKTEAGVFVLAFNSGVGEAVATTVCKRSSVVSNAGINFVFIDGRSQWSRFSPNEYN